MEHGIQREIKKKEKPKRRLPIQTSLFSNGTKPFFKLQLHGNHTIRMEKVLNIFPK